MVDYAVYKIGPEGYSKEAIATGTASSLESAVKAVVRNHFKGAKSSTEIIDKITANIIIDKPQPERYKVVILPDRPLSSKT